MENRNRFKPYIIGGAIAVLAGLLAGYITTRIRDRPIDIEIIIPSGVELPIEIKLEPGRIEYKPPEPERVRPVRYRDGFVG